jgi:phage tail-like protein
MSQAGQVISLQLSPMQLPDATPSQKTRGRSLTGVADSTTTKKKSLLVRPGEPSEMVVQLRNIGNRPIQINLQLKGIPNEWYQIGTEGSEILPGQQMEAVLYFQIPSDYFESDTALQPGETLKINYIGHLYASTYEPDTGKRQVETSIFDVYIRPHSLYLNFLPAVYREVDFIGRFLKIFEQSFEPCIKSLDNLWAYLDPLTAPQALLPFLAQWVAWETTPQISVERQRHLIKTAMDIYKWRGTKRGLRFYLHLATGLPLDEQILDETEKHIAITEFFSRGFVFGAARLSEDAIFGGSRPFHFTVRLRASRENLIDEYLVKNIIEQEKPAFCSYDLIIKT